MIGYEELKDAEKVLRDRNYQHFVSCSKVKQVEFFEPNLKMYKTAPFSEWCDYFEMDKKVSKHLIDNLLDFELTINSRVSHYLSDLMESGTLTDHERNEIIVFISRLSNRSQASFSAYNGNETWNFVYKMTFGEMKHLVFWLYDHKHEVYLKVVDGYSLLRKNVKNRFNELNHLRNSLFHLTPLTVYLTYGTVRNWRLNSSERKKVVRWISDINVYQEMRDRVNEICYYSDNYLKIKNSLRNAD